MKKLILISLIGLIALSGCATPETNTGKGAAYGAAGGAVAGAVLGQAIAELNDAVVRECPDDAGDAATRAGGVVAHHRERNDQRSEQQAREREREAAVTQAERELLSRQRDLEDREEDRAHGSARDLAERLFLVHKLEENGWNVTQTAQMIETPRSNLYKKLDQYGISQETDG